VRAREKIAALVEIATIADTARGRIQSEYMGGPANMGAVLERNDSSGKPTVLPDGMANSEVVKCDDKFCHTSYTIA
jgi:hypothetical protein